MPGAGGDAPSPDEIRDRARDVLSDPAFGEQEPSLVERILDEIGERLSTLLSSGSGPGTVLGYVFVAVLVAGLAYVLVRAAGIARPLSVPDRPALLTETERDRTADEWLAAAAEAEARGDREEGLRCRFRALVAALVDDGLLDGVAGRTTGELRRELRGPGAADFAAAADLFDDVWYGGRPASVADTTEMIERSQRVLEAGEAGRAGRAATAGAAP